MGPATESTPQAPLGMFVAVIAREIEQGNSPGKPSYHQRYRAQLLAEMPIDCLVPAGRREPRSLEQAAATGFDVADLNNM